MRPELSSRSPRWRGGLLLLALALPACGTDWLPHADLAPVYHPAEFVVPASWKGASPFVEADPADDELRPDWWKLYNDPMLDTLIEQAMATNPDLQAAAERFVQARDVMMQVRSQRIPQVGLGGKATDSHLHINPDIYDPETPLTGPVAAGGGIASWEPDFWSAIRNATRVETYRAQERAADWGLARLSLQAEIASDYFTLRGYDAQAAIYQHSIDLYKRSLALVNAQFAGAIASALDVARVESLLYSTETKYAQIQGQRQITEQALAILVNMAPASFTIEPVDELRVVKFAAPASLPSRLLERRPDIAAMERRMAEANRAIGIARAAFFPDVRFRADGGILDVGFNAVEIAKFVTGFWSYGSLVSVPAFQGGYRRAQLQKSWSAYRETEDRYRSTVLNAFREVENNLSLTNRLTVAAGRQDAAVGANLKAQNLTTELYQGGLASSLELIFAQVNTLTARIDAVQIKTELMRASVALIRALGGGWDRRQLPKDEQIQPFGTFQYVDLDKPPPAGGIDVNADNNWLHNDLTKFSVPGRR
ncbi:efflux transporter outer membrane subunit [Nitrospira moscoviensis]|uniref:Outer membrane efflux protein n=1 Tax=Nitrospira moscoviensis TaxID=42253 RepID=A0A0K2GF94_NITMO|nr:efflux transporter outer membrane subunit [Nitrospira moscoviensis]ALA59628.1 Outer membrane efflux protein [Nitrospira moscoviensis]